MVLSILLIEILILKIQGLFEISEFVTEEVFCLPQRTVRLNGSSASFTLLECLSSLSDSHFNANHVSTNEK